LTPPRILRIKDAAAYLNVSRQRAAKMHGEGKLPAPDQIDGLTPLWEAAATIERWAGREWWGNAAVSTSNWISTKLDLWL
jgi:hypothetical protein